MGKERIKERCRREDIALKVLNGFLERDCIPNTELYYAIQRFIRFI